MRRQEKLRAAVQERLGEPVLAVGFVRVRSDGHDLPATAALVVTEAKLRIWRVTGRLHRALLDEVEVWDRRSVWILFDRRAKATRLTVSVPGGTGLVIDVPRHLGADGLLHTLAGGSVVAA